MKVNWPLIMPVKVTFVLQASIAAFGVYFCMYAYRKPFTVATFKDLYFIGINYKILLIIAQILGYTLSKFIGIKVVSEMKPAKRIYYLLTFIGLSELALLGFALVPAPYNIVFLFFNGLPLGMIWGIVFSYLEGRKSSEILGVILCSSFIVSSGIVKSVGKFVIDTLLFNEYWMPFVTGALFIIPLLFFTKLLEKLPVPTKEDQQEKTSRKPLNKIERKQLFIKFAIPLTLIIFFYTMLTAARDFRDNFARELWDAIGYQDNAAVYSLSEIPIAIIVLILLGMIGRMTNNKKAFKFYHYILFLGCFCIIISTILFQLQKINPLVWMMISGFGLYICYIPFNGLFFDRMIATFKFKGNVGFLIYTADAFGYLGSVFILLFKNFGYKNISWLVFFTYSIYAVAIIGIIVATISLLHFNYFQSKKYIKNTLQYE